jgi:hypothetical protein
MAGSRGFVGVLLSIEPYIYLCANNRARSLKAKPSYIPLKFVAQEF